MKFIRFLLCAGFVFCPFAVRADDSLSCEKFKTFQTQTEVIFHISEVDPIVEFSLAELGRMRERYFYVQRHAGENTFWIADHENMGGYFMAGYGTKIEYGLKVIPYPEMPMLSCVLVEKMQVIFEYTGTIFLDKNYDLPECAAVKVDAMSLMNDRYAMVHGIIDEKQLKLRNEMPEIISKLEKIPIETDKVKQRVEEIESIFVKASMNYPKLIEDDIYTKNVNLAGDEAVAAKWVACRTQK